ncbi:MarR family transcriptional regulator [Arthrobacter sp. NamB2]|uniref:MarR family transcriptional regulator n=1 Tax=Arthrobacter sp. NamB2 TaxID=2576035 RepID=UPI0010C9C387|nr:MarR family transcriptional regulator [Arthrobacter sp. NamB2]TKV27936.1 MarR family transcriptional regulator [Arthrobacter sp. NamB2]
MFVLTIDQAGSRSTRDRVPDLLDLLQPISAVLPWERSVGDEAQGVVAAAADVVDAVLLCLRDGDWYVGVGIGEVERPLPASPREGRGSAFVAARKAVDRAKKTGDRAPLAVEGPDGERGAAEAEGVLALLGRHVMDRSEAEWRILDLLQPGVRGTQTAVARVLGISPQAVSKAAARAAWHEEQAVRPAAARLLAWVDGALPPPPDGGAVL